MGFVSKDSGSSVSEPPPELDPVVPDEPKSVPQTVASPLSMLEHYVPENVSQLEDRLKRCRVRKQRPVNLVCPMVYIGDEEIANDQEELRRLCVTHILNAAAPKKKLKHFFGKKPAEDTERTVNTGSRNYNGWRIKYHTMPTTERHCSDMSKCFKPAAKYIKKILKQRNGQVLVCCKDGENHSATLVLAYLMIYYQMLLEDAIDYVIEVRRIMPSRDFLEKLLVNAELVIK
ncbi:dual specificity protein phosphatase 3-like [Garra rufa]|uniref:dual specificity protein phosphatase 3-like n=1 Tax=Garra rufa TaxID=137080 RepID=UPI003CCEDA1A